MTPLTDGKAQNQSKDGEYAGWDSQIGLELFDECSIKLYGNACVHFLIIILDLVYCAWLLNVIPVSGCPPICIKEYQDYMSYPSSHSQESQERFITLGRISWLERFLHQTAPSFGALKAWYFVANALFVIILRQNDRAGTIHLLYFDHLFKT